MCKDPGVGEAGLSRVIEDCRQAGQLTVTSVDILRTAFYPVATGHPLVKCAQALTRTPGWGGGGAVCYKQAASQWISHQSIAPYEDSFEAPAFRFQEAACPLSLYLESLLFWVTDTPP